MVITAVPSVLPVVGVMEVMEGAEKENNTLEDDALAPPTVVTVMDLPAPVP